MRRSISVVLAMCIASLSFCVAGDVAEKPALIKALLITGDDVSVHPWREISETTREILVKSGRVDVKVCEDPWILESEAALKQYDVIVFTIYSRRISEISGQAQENLLNFVKGGKGFFAQHLASASFPKWEEFGKLCGRKWVMGTSGHGPRSVFTSNVVNKEHPVTAGLSDFETNDELYAKLQGTGAINVLVSADSDWSKKTEPLVFTQNYGRGRVVHNAYGHDRKALMTPNVQKIIARGVEWAATGKVADTEGSKPEEYKAVSPGELKFAIVGDGTSTKLEVAEGGGVLVPTGTFGKLLCDGTEIACMTYKMDAGVISTKEYGKIKVSMGGLGGLTVYLTQTQKEKLMGLKKSAQKE